MAAMATHAALEAAPLQAAPVRSKGALRGGRSGVAAFASRGSAHMGTGGVVALGGRQPGSGPAGGRGGSLIAPITFPITI